MTIIESVEINGFKSIAESGEVNLHDNITTLVGPNEAGKTGFLEAIEFFSHEKEITDEQICDYDSSLDADGKPVVEINASGVNPSNFSTGFGNINEISEVEGNISITIKKYSNGDYEVTSSDIDRELQRYKSTRSDRIEAAIGNLESIINQIEENLEESVENYSEIKRIINSIRSSGRITGRAQSIPRITTLLEELRQELRFDSDLETRQLMFRISESVDKLESLRPAAQIFVNEIFNIYIRKEFSLIGDGKDIGEIDYSDNSDPYSNLLQYIGEPPEEIRNMDTRSRRKLISERMNDFSEQFSEVWGQENIEFDLDLVNNSIQLLITDESVEEQYVEQRSQGFRYFLTFFISLISESRSGRVSDQVILLDDPGLHLHPERKSDLLKSLETLSEDNQIIYTTHSPYMIDTSHLDRIRVVTPGKGKSGTEIESDLSKVDAHDADSLKPIRGALGAGFSDSIFTSGKSLLTEGYTDRVYISSMAHILNKRDSESLPSGCGILDMGSDGKWNKYTRFLDSEGFKYHLLLDSDKAKNNSMDKIEKSEHISREQVTFIDDVISEVEGDTTIESLMGQELLTKILHELYGLNMENIDIDESKPKPIIDQAEEVVSREHNQGNDAFKKPEIAEYFCEEIKERPEEFPTDVCLERFDSLFSKVSEDFR